MFGILIADSFTGGGSIELQEFVRMMSRSVRNYDAEEELRETFQVRHSQTA